MVNWTEITETYPNFTSELQKKWETKGFSAEETKEWMEFGLEPAEVDFADWLKKKYNVTAEEFLGDDDMEELRGRYRKELEESSEESREEEKQNAQDWLNQKYPKEERENIKELYINKESVEGKLDLSDFPNLEKIFISHFVDKNKLEINDEEKYENKIVNLKNAQKFLEEYLEENYPGKQKSEIESLSFCNENLEGELDLSDFINLEVLNCSYNQLTNLKINNCWKLRNLDCGFNKLMKLDLTGLEKLEEIQCYDNYLTGFDYSSLNPDKLTFLNISANDLSEQDCSVFSQFANLETLWIGNDNEEHLTNNIYNKFTGSLEPLKGLEKLKDLHIKNTDIDSGLEHLPDSIETLRHEVMSDEFKVSKICEQLAPCNNDIEIWKEWKRRGLKSEEVKQWREVGLKEVEYDFASYLKKEKNLSPQEIGNDLDNLKEDFNNWVKIAQNYLNNYLPEEKGKINNLNISDKDLEGQLDLRGFTNLKELNFLNNKITELNLEDCANLESLNCSNNLLAKTDFLNQLSDPNKLAYLDIKNNNLETQDLSFLKSFINLERLYLGNNDEERIKKGKFNRFTGSLEYLQNLASLKTIDISNIDINNGLEFLPDNLNQIYCSNEERPESEVRKIKEQLVLVRDGKYAKRQEVQQWLDKNFPEDGVSILAGYEGKTKSEIIKLDISEKGLVGKLDLSDFENLTDLNCSYNQLNELNLTGLTKLENLSFNDNLIERFEFSLLNPEKLTSLDLRNNNLSEQSKKDIDISIFSKFTKLKQLLIGNDNKEKIEENKYNHFVGSLNSLKGLTDLENLHISNVDINQGNVEDLPEKLSIIWFNCSAEERPKSKVKNIQEKLYSHLTKKRLNEMYPDKSDKVLDYLWSERLKGHLDLSEYKDLEVLDCHSNELTSIDVSKNTKLKKLSCFNNKLKEINLANNINLETLDCSKNELTELLGVENFSKLKELTISDNKFSDEGEKMLTRMVEKLTILNDKRDKWKEISVQSWLDKKYPLGGKERENMRELNISEQELTGELKLASFSELKHLTCRNNQLTEIDLSDCPKLVGIDCRNNKLTKLTFNMDCNLKELRASDNEFDRIENIFKKIKDKTEDKYSSSSLNYFDVRNNKISNVEIGDFAKFKSLKFLLVGNDDENGKNDFTGSLKDLSGLDELLEINICGSERIKISDFLGLKDEELDEAMIIEQLPKKLEKIYYFDNKNKSKKSGDNKEKDAEKDLSKVKWYDKENNFYDMKKLKSGSDMPHETSVKALVKIPVLLKKEERIEEVEERKERWEKESYFDQGKLIYPSEKETEFIWKVGEPLLLSRLPSRLCYITSEFNENRDPKIEIKSRIECEDATHYAILSYTWDGPAKEKMTWNTENAWERLSPGGEKSLSKALKTLEVLNNFHLFKEGSEIRYLWMDQLCIDQNPSSNEKQHEIPQMRDYYGNSTVTLVAVHETIGEETMKKLLNSFEKGESGLIHPDEIIKNSLPILKKIINSNWFKRSWTYQEGFLSKQTIFMFDDFLIDGRFMALVWKLRQFSEAHYEECNSIKKLCENKIATPVGWVYYEWKEGGKNERGYSLSDKASLKLSEALWAVKNRGRSIALDGIYSIAGLLPYGKKIKVNYDKDPESVLREVMFIATKSGHGEPLAWHGVGSKKPGLCWVPEMDGGVSSVRGSISIDYKPKEGNIGFEQDKGIKVNGSEYIIAWKDNGIYKAEREETVEGGLWRREIWVKRNENDKDGVILILSGTKEGVQMISKEKVLIIPNREEWRSDKPFAILALKVKGNSMEEKKEKNNIRHRMDLLRIEEGYEKLVAKSEGEDKDLKIEEKTFIIGLNNQEDVNQYQAQIQVDPK